MCGEDLCDSGQESPLKHSPLKSQDLQMACLSGSWMCQQLCRVHSPTRVSYVHLVKLLRFMISSCTCQSEGWAQGLGLGTLPKALYRSTVWGKRSLLSSLRGLSIRVTIVERGGRLIPVLLRSARNWCTLIRMVGIRSSSARIVSSTVGFRWESRVTVVGPSISGRCVGAKG
jgi:hypothetical protein